MKRQISTILTLTILTTSLPSPTCFANDMSELITVQENHCEECASGGVPSAAKENHLSKSTTEQTKHNKIWETVSNLHVGDTLRSAVARAKQSKAWKTLSNLSVSDTLKSTAKRAKQSKAWKTLSNLSVSDTLKSTAKRAKQSKAWKTLSNLSVNDTLKSVAVQVKQSKALKITAGTTVGASAVAGTAVAGLKIFEDSLPESVKEYLPNWLKKDDTLKLKQTSSPENEFDDKRMESDADNEEKCSANSHGAMEDVRDTEIPENITKSEPEKSDSDNQEKCPAKCYDDMEDVRDTEMPGNTTKAVPKISDLDNQEKCPAKSYDDMEDVRDTEMPGNITTKTEPEISDSDNQGKCPAKCYETMEDVRDTEMPGNITNSTSNVNNSGNVTQPKQPQSRKKSVKPIMNKNNEEGHKKGTDWNRVAENFKSATVTVLSPIIALAFVGGLLICGNRTIGQKITRKYFG